MRQMTLAILIPALSLLAIPAAAQNSGGASVFTIGALTYTSNYPLGMTWTIEAASSAGSIVRATLFYDFGGPTTGRVQAELPPGADGVITATLNRYDADGLIPWLDVHYTWRLTDVAGNSIEVPGPPAIYEDTTREWQHAENNLVRVYWFGLPDWVGSEALDAVEQARERWALGFPGVALESRPLVVIYPDLESFLEWRGEAGAESLRFVGTLREEWNGTVQRVPDQARLDRECGGLDLVRDYDYIVRALARSTVVHELTHFHQYAMNSASGPAWWVEGQATFFEDPIRPYDINARVRRLAAMGALPSLAYGDTLSGAGTLGPDGCTHLAYDVGAAFLEFLRENYGGYEAHGQITALVARNTGIYAAIGQITGRSFAELEAEWRASIGAGPAPTPFPTSTPFLFTLPTPIFQPPGSGTGS
ncbi:MAG: hypothetical protein HPY64_11765 [Anaerolineae bacterium]|nr:hypothetical protein [Anaerolineae bacterium]